MKEKILALVLLFVIISFVVSNTLIMRNQIDEIKGDLINLKIGESAPGEAERLYQKFKKSQKYLSLTVNHEDITNIEDSFVEMIGYIDVENYKDAEVTKNRLICSLEHLRRLSGFTLDAII